MTPISEACEVPIWATACEPPPVARRIVAAIARRWLLLGLASMFVLGMCIGPRAVRVCGESKVEVSKARAEWYAREAYPAWRLAHPDRTCPTSLAELDHYARATEPHDLWGRAYTFTCADGTFVVRSPGEDGVAGTDDDITGGDQ
jgi:hypothetical protein